MWGFTGLFDHNNGGGFLSDIYREARKAIWDFSGIIICFKPSYSWCTLCRTNPSRFELIRNNVRNWHFCVWTISIRIDGLCTLAERSSSRTIPPRENSGNCDIKDMSRGSRVYYPVYVKGAKLSVGDIYFSQGDGEVAFCGGIEMVWTFPRSQNWMWMRRLCFFSSIEWFCRPTCGSYFKWYVASEHQ